MKGDSSYIHAKYCFFPLFLSIVVALDRKEKCWKASLTNFSAASLHMYMYVAVGENTS